MESVYLFLISYIVLFIIYFIFYYKMGLKKKTIEKSIQFRYLTIRFKLNKKDLKPKKIGLIVCFLDPLIISLTGTIISMPKWHYIIELLLGFILLMAFIYSFYEILGRILKRKVIKK